MSGESASRWTVLFTGVSAVCSVLSLYLLFTQTPLYVAPPSLSFVQSTTNTNERGEDGKYESKLATRVTNHGSQPAKDITVIVKPIQGDSWVVSSIYESEIVSSPSDLKAFKIRMLPANTEAKFECIEKVMTFPPDQNIWRSSDYDEYDKEAGSEEFSYEHSVKQIFTAFGPVSERDGTGSIFKHLRAIQYLPADYRSKEGKERREKLLTSKGLRDSGLFARSVVPIEKTDERDRSSDSKVNGGGRRPIEP